MPNCESELSRANNAVLFHAEKVRNSPYIPVYHITAPSGWINDPNGCIFYNDKYHVFYQHHPFSPKWGPMFWGHVSSKDLVHWQHEPIALAPDQPYETGCFSGCAVNDDGIMTLIYTAHNDLSASKETQCVARSDDGGNTFIKSAKNPVIASAPVGFSADFRDPSVWRENKLWHLIVGSSFRGVGCVLKYTSPDLEHWIYRGIFALGDEDMGSMWECPNFFHLDDHDLLIVSPMEMPGHKNIALFGKTDPGTNVMHIDHYQELDFGDDFYAAQILKTGDRVLLFAWMDMWGRHHPTEIDGWSGALTIPRELHIKNGHLYQLPAPELSALREARLIGQSDPDELSNLSGNCLELNIDAFYGKLTLFDSEGMLLSISIQDGIAVFELPDQPKKTAELAERKQNNMRIYIDRCSAECFINEGEISFSQRFYPKDNRLSFRLEGSGIIDAWKLGPSFRNEQS